MFFARARLMTSKTHGCRSHTYFVSRWHSREGTLTRSTMSESEMASQSGGSGSSATIQGHTGSDAPEENCSYTLRNSPRNFQSAARNSSDGNSRSVMAGVEADMGMGENSSSRGLSHTSKSLTTTSFIAFEQLRQLNQLCDVTIRVGSSETVAHRVVLAATCPYFRGMFTAELSEKQQDIITLKEVDASAVEALISFLYTGSIEVTEDNVQGLLPAANLFQLTEVCDACCRFLKSQLHPSNCLGIIAFADLHSCSSLLTESQRFSRKYFPEVRMSDEFIQLPADNVIDLISSSDLNVKSEEDVFEAVVQWVSHDREGRLTYLPTLLNQVHYQELSNSYILKHVSDNELLKDNPSCKDFIINALKYRLMTPAERASLAESSEGFSRVRIGGPQSILIVGGQAPKAIRSIEIYDVKTNTCRAGPELVSRRCRCGVTVLKGSVYAVGGFDGTSRVRSVERLDLDKGWWVPVEPMLSRRSTLGVAVLYDELYAVGGFDGTNGLDTVEKYNPGSKAWITVSNMSTRRSSVGVAVLNGLLYAVGGYDGVARQCLNSVECYNPDMDEWQAVEPMTQRRSGAAVAVLDGMLYAVGGHNGPDIRKSVERYDPSTKCWQRLPDMSTPRRNAAACMVRNYLYVMGGDDGVMNLSTIEILDPCNLIWKCAEGKLTQGRSYAGMAIIDRQANSLPF